MDTKHKKDEEGQKDDKLQREKKSDTATIVFSSFDAEVCSSNVKVFHRSCKSKKPCEEAIESLFFLADVGRFDQSCERFSK